VLAILRSFDGLGGEAKKSMKTLFKIVPWLFLALFATEIVVVMLPKKPGEYHIAEFGRLPALLNGRIQPLDSVARNTLLQIRSTGDVPLELLPGWQFWRHPKKLRSSEWLLEVFFKPEVADTRAIFLIHHPDIVSELKLGESGIEKSGLRYYTYNEIKSVVEEIMAQATTASNLESAQRTPYQKQILKLANGISLYQRLKNSVQPEGTEDFVQLLTDYRALVPAGVAAMRAQQMGQEANREDLNKFISLAQKFEMAANRSLPRVVPPQGEDHDRELWANVGATMLGVIRGGEVPPAVDFYARIARGYTQNDAATFNGAVAEYQGWLREHFTPELKKSRAEYYFNQTKMFVHATIIYIFAFVLAGGALLTLGTWPNASEAFRRSAYYLIALACVVHTAALIYRMALEGRPPVTNLYSSAIFIGWGACVLGLILEKIYRVGLGSAMAGLSGFVTLLIAHNLALGGDTMEMMRAVLDTNFWLATHVVVITLGYSATFAAGGLAVAYVLLGIFTPVLARQAENLDLSKAIAKMVYAIICFAILFNFTGTVLGGIWADQSWGRFWGWDPKENGALLIVIWNALILHARWGGLVKDRGLMNLAIFGNIVTAWSWFGTNMLGIGLHSYGFMDAAFRWLMLFFGSQIAIIILGALPLNMWKSFQTKQVAQNEPA
jgi:ABC-type transport system involved in cytochrome c biogenesis permease subunit